MTAENGRVSEGKAWIGWEDGGKDVFNFWVGLESSEGQAENGAEL